MIYRSKYKKILYYCHTERSNNGYEVECISVLKNLCKGLKITTKLYFHSSYFNNLEF